MKNIKITATIIVSAVLVFALYAATQTASPTVAILYGEEYRLLKEKELDAVPGLTPCFAMINVMTGSAEQNLIEKHNIKPDPEKLAAVRKTHSGFTTESLHQLNETTNHRITIAEAFIETFGDNSATTENIDTFYSQYETSPVMTMYEREKVDFILQHFLPTMKHVKQLKKNMVSTIDPFLEQFEQNAQASAKYETFRNLIIKDHPVTDEDVQRARQSPNADPIWSEFSLTDMKLHLTREKENYILSSVLLRKVKADITVLDAEKYNQCLNEWEEKFITPWATIFSDTQIPDESILQIESPD